MNVENTTTESPTLTPSSPSSSPDAPRVSLLSRDLGSLNDEELKEFVAEVRKRGTSIALSAEMKPTRKASTKVTNRVKVLDSLLSNDTDELTP
jgi:hypothetical protein